MIIQIFVIDCLMQKVLFLKRFKYDALLNETSLCYQKRIDGDREENVFERIETCIGMSDKTKTNKLFIYVEEL